MREGGAVRCAIYVRLSREDEEKHRSESESIQNQKSLLIAWAVERGWDIYRIYCDEDRSGADSLRPDFNRMIEAAREGKFQVILCKSQSRFTRDMELVEKYIHGLFPLWGIRFIAVADNADTAVRGNKKARQINGLVNEWYLEDLSENIRMVFDMKRRQGQYIGSSALYGYRKDPDDKNRLLVDPEAAAVVEQIFRWAREGMGSRTIAQRLNALGVLSPARYKARRGWGGGEGGAGWGKTAVWRILRNEMYTGTMVQGRSCRVSYKSKATAAVPREKWFRVEGTHPPIVDRETFLAVQRRLELPEGRSGPGQVHPLAGLVRCMDCGRAMTRTSNGRGDGKAVYYLRCRRSVGSGAEKKCSRHSVRLSDLLALVEERLRIHLARCCPPELMARAFPAGERLSRDLLTALIDRVEVGERSGETGEQAVRIFWRF